MVKEKVKGETSRDRFKRLAVIRTKKVIDKLRVLGHCANKSVYAYEDEDVKKIFSAIDKELKRVKSKFNESKAGDFQL